MKIKLYREHGALNSKDVFDAFEEGAKLLGHEIVDSGEDVSVIWSVLWSGRMQGNKGIYEECRKSKKPIIIIEVGSLARNTSWKIGLGHINSLGLFGNDSDLDVERPKKLGIELQPLKEHRRREILIACQHDRSLQWESNPPMNAWVQETVSKIKQYTDRHIVVRPHPRSASVAPSPNYTLVQPKRLVGTYDDFDFDYNYHCIVNFCSGPGILAAIGGVPIICDRTSLAAEMSGTFEKIEEITLPDREEWFLKLCHTEWLVDEIRQGIPLKRLEKYLKG